MEFFSKHDKILLNIFLVILLNVCVSESTYSNNNFNQNYNYNYQNYGRNLNPVSVNTMNQNPLLKRWDLPSILMGRLRNGLGLIQGSLRTNNYKSNSNGNFNPSAYTNYKSNHGYDYNYNDYNTNNNNNNYNYNSLGDETQGRGFNTMDSSSWIPQSPQSQFYDFNMADVVHTYQDSYWQEPQPKTSPLSNSKSVTVRSKGYSTPEVSSKPVPKKKSRRQTVPLPSITERSVGYDNSRSRTRASRWSSQSPTSSSSLSSGGRYGNKNRNKSRSRPRGRSVNVEGQWPNCGYDPNSFDQRCCFEEDANLRTQMKMDEAQGYLVADRTSYYWDDNRGRCLQSLPVPMHHTAQTNYIDQTDPYEKPTYDDQYQNQNQYLNQDSYSASPSDSYADSNSNSNYDYNYNYNYNNDYDQTRRYDQKTSPSQGQRRSRSGSDLTSGSWPESSSSGSGSTSTSFGSNSVSKSKSKSKPISSASSKSKTYSSYSTSTSKKSTTKPKPKQKSTPKTKLQLMNTRSFRGTTYQLYKEMPQTVSSSTSIYY